MDKKESATSNSDRDRRQRRLREIKTKGMKKSRSLSTQRLLSAKITIAMWIYSWSSRYCRNWTESLFEASKRIEETKWSWATCWTSWWEIVSEISSTTKTPYRLSHDRWDIKLTKLILRFRWRGRSVNSFTALRYLGSPTSIPPAYARGIGKLISFLWHFIYRDSVCKTFKWV